MKTRKNLHSQNHLSPISENKEISCFGNDGFGDEKDDWVIKCENEKGKDLMGNMQFKLLHKKSKTYLNTSIRHKYDRQ